MSNNERNLYEFSAAIKRIGNRAVHKAQEENRKRGIPNVYSKNGHIYYQLPDGTITTRKPDILKEE